MKKKFIFSDQDKAVVKSAIESLEKESSGEIVIYFARSSDDYLEACWKLAAILSVSGLAIMGTMSWLWLLPEDLTIFSTSIYLLSLVALGFLVPAIVPTLRLGFIPRTVIAHRVLTKARDMFLQEEVFTTIDRTGILIYVSELERSVQVLGDKGINAKIEANDWNEVVGLVIAGIKSDQTAKGIANAVLKCKALLLENGFVVREDDTNELSDEIRIED
ncbi:hypothetical protein N6H18_02260 [Reichenbachiella agarivorans]|uniref:TPM domain-containing protein n=1 Tax=Reichenbachiella agarivorans TaxID=2979464 RepID=A0ABY6CRY8_9BACT|nr:hypothetical protein [Reichenbachiella agarivorans]UXP32785.1 hypothetical protein N6H18_02260 [Reichenbachiella agarivorans]